MLYLCTTKAHSFLEILSPARQKSAKSIVIANAKLNLQSLKLTCWERIIAAVTDSMKIAQARKHLKQQMSNHKAPTTKWEIGQNEAPITHM